MSQVDEKPGLISYYDELKENELVLRLIHKTL